MDWSETEKLEMCTISLRGIECMIAYGQKAINDYIDKGVVTHKEELGWLLLTQLSIPTIKKYCGDIIDSQLKEAEEDLIKVIDDIEVYGVK